jgi:hypothetical protein
MRSVVIIAALTILGVAASGFVLAQRESTRTTTAALTAHINVVTQETSALPADNLISQIDQTPSSEVLHATLEANVDAQSIGPAQYPSAAIIKDQSLSSISKAMAHEITRLKDDATGWAHKLQELEVDLKLQLDLKRNQDAEATGKDLNECLVVLRAAAGRLAPDAEARVTLHKQEVAVRDLAVRAEVYLAPEIRNAANYFQQLSSELRALNRSVEETRTRLVTQIDRLENLESPLEFDRISRVVKDSVASIGNIESIAEDAHRITADLKRHRRGGQ